jgi:hypothetical protein
MNEVPEQVPLSGMPEQSARAALALASAAAVTTMARTKRRRCERLDMGGL